MVDLRPQARVWGYDLYLGGVLKWTGELIVGR